MDCQEARKGMWPPERPRLVGQAEEDARRHIEDCAECAAYFHQDRVLLAAYDRIRQEPAPLEVRERVFDALAHARWEGKGRRASGELPTLGWRRYTPWMLAVAASLVAISVGTFDPGAPGVAEGPEMFVEDYLRRAVGQDHIETSDPVEVRHFLERELGVQVRPIDYAGWELERAEICLLEGRRGAMIVYKKDGAAISHYMVPREATPGRDPALSRSGESDGSDMPVVTWSTPNIEQALVGEIAPDQLLRLASSGAGGTQ